MGKGTRALPYFFGGGERGFFAALHVREEEKPILSSAQGTRGRFRQLLLCWGGEGKGKKKHPNMGPRALEKKEKRFNRMTDAALRKKARVRRYFRKKHGDLSPFLEEGKGGRVGNLPRIKKRGLSKRLKRVGGGKPFANLQQENWPCRRYQKKRKRDWVEEPLGRRRGRQDHGREGLRSSTLAKAARPKVAHLNAAQRRKKKGL